MFSVKSVVDESLKLPLFTRQVGGSRPTYIHACYKATNHKARGGGALTADAIALLVVVESI